MKRKKDYYKKPSRWKIRHTKQLNRSMAGNTILFVIMGICGVFMALPLVMILNNALKPLDELFRYPPQIFVRNPSLDNFSDLYVLMSSSWVPFTRYVLNTLIITGLGTVGHVLFASLAAYPLAKHDFPGKKFLFSMVVLSLMFSYNVTAIPNYMIISWLGINNTYLAVILPAFAYGLGLYLMKQFMEQLVLPAMSGSAAARERARDELPQSAAGRTIMTTEPKFIPETAVPLQLEGGGACRVRLIDCVGYMVEGAMGHEEDAKPRMVKSPWFEQEVPFDLAAETGTRKVICEHSTIGVVVTTDGSVSDIPRAGYAEAEKRVVTELEALGKPYIILLNSTHPDAPETRQLAEGMARDYRRTVLPVSCVDLDAAMLGEILRRVLYEFPVQELDFALPRWVTMLEPGHWLQAQVYTAAMQLAERVSRMKDLPAGTDAPALECDAVQRSAVAGADLAAGSVRVSLELKPEIFYQVLSEQTGLDIGDEAGLMPCIMELARAKRAYEKVRSALEQVEATGYGIVMPSIDELHLEPPEIVHQDGRCGVRLQACAPSIQMMKATIHTELSPIVGTEKQSEDLVQSLLADFADDPVQLWESNIFGKSLHELVNDGLQNKLLHIPQEARTRLQETLERVINEGCTGLICILI